MEHHGKPHSFAWATADQWERHKEKIIDLYWDQDKPLKEVLETMKREHSFNATMRMYKVRFKAWGVTKYLKAQDANHLRARATTGELASLPVIRGREVGSMKLKRHLNQAQVKAEIDARVRFFHALSGNSATFHSLELPDYLKHAHVGVRAIQIYTQSRFDGKLWNLTGREYDFNIDTASSWWTDMELAIEVLPHDPRRAFLLFEVCFERYDALISHQDPSLILATLILLSAPSMHDDIADSLIRYIASLSSIRLGVTHPFTRIWGQFHAMGLMQTRRAIPTILRAYLDVIRRNTSRGGLFWMLSSLHTHRLLVEYSAVSYESVQISFDEIIREAEEAKETKFDESYVEWMGIYKSRLLVAAGRYTEALKLLNGFNTDDLCDYFNGEPLENCRAIALDSLGRHEEATIAYEKCFQYSVSLNDTYCLALGYLRLYNHYNIKGDQASADKIQPGYDRTWARLVEKVKRGKLNNVCFVADYPPSS
ncbi:Clr5 domain-containing protein [Xylariales sp. PMI_506]|nr:Clr5 domain-containing protein [Xylariales sp. PMI_506]